MKLNRSLLFLGITVLFCGGFKILDPESSNPFLAPLEWILDSNGIDIVQDWRSNVLLEGRPVLAPIANYNVSVMPKETEWIKAFRENYANAIVAIQTEINEAEFDFLKEWNSISSDKKVFISFTQDDLQFAEIIKSALEDRGYIVFLYKESNRDAFTSPELIAQCMRDADNVLILDTENSRIKEGVIAEALAFAEYQFQPSQNFAANKQIAKKINDDIGKNIDLSGYDNTKLVNESIEFYKEIYGIDYTAGEIVGKLYDDYRVDLNNIKDFQFDIEDSEYQRIIRKNNQSQLQESLNLKLTNLNQIELPIAGNFSKFLFIVDKLSICPYYKIPKAVCPICNERLR